MLHSTYNGYQVHLIQNLSEFDFIKQNLNEKVNVGLDSEDTGLDYLKDEVVGVCIACGHGYDKDHYHGFYIPIRHLNYKGNLPVKETIELVQFIVDNYKTVWWNRNYDATMLEKDGFVMPFIGKTHDAQCMAHLVMGESFPALKDFANRLLKFDVIEFSENNAKDHNFGSTDPTITFKYAAQDPLVTTLTARKIWTDYPYIRKIYPIDNKFAESIRRLSMDAPIYLDRELLEKLYNENAAELSKVKQEIFSTVGYQFKLNSNKDKADVLSRYVTLTQKTAKGAFAVSDEVLASIDHPVARLLQKYAELEKLRGTYLAKMREFAQPFYVNYQHCNVSCLTEDNIVRTYEQGLISIKDVEVGMHVLSENGFYPVESKAVFKDEVIKVTLRNGAFIEGNKKHPVLLSDGSWAKLGDLKEGQRVMMCRPFVESKSKVILPEVKWNKTSRTKVFEFSRVLDTDFASILGFLDGDGSIVKDGVKLCFSEFEPEVEDYYVNLFAKRLNINIPKRCVDKDHTVQYKFCSTPLSRWFKDLGVKPHGEESGIDVSKWGTEEQMAYVAALFDTDGSLSTQVKTGRFNLVLAMTSKGVIDNVAKILRFHGIDVHLSEVSQGRKLPLYRLRVRSFKKFRIFIERIGKYMHCSHKLDRLNSLEFNYESHYNRWVGKEDSSEVISIESKGIKQVYDITVGTDHTFIANGIVTHNTGRMSSGTSKGNSYFAPINIQNIPKVEIYKYLHKGGELGYYLDYNKENAIAKMKCKGGMRDLFIAPEGYVWISGDYCLDPESIVITPQGNVKLKDLVEGQLVFTPEGYKRCYNVRKTGKHKIVKIKLKTGEVLKCSAEHRILIKRNGLIMWKKAGELISTDYIFNINNIKYLENHGINIRDVEEDSGR